MSDFPEFALDKEIPACTLTRELLHQIEKQLAAAESDLYRAGESVFNRRLDISVFDTFGVETFCSAGDIPTSGFPETTNAVRIVLESNDSQHGQAQRSFKCKMAFRDSLGNYVALRLRGPQARERAIGLYERIRQLTDSQSLDNWLFRRRDWVSSLLGLTVFLLGLIWLGETYSLVTSRAEEIDRSAYFVRTAVLLTSGAYLVAVRYFFPPCAFETSRWARIQQWRTWAAQGFAGLLVFDVLIFVAGERMVRLMGL